MIFAFSKKKKTNIIIQMTFLSRMFVGRDSGHENLTIHKKKQLLFGQISTIYSLFFFGGDLWRFYCGSVGDHPVLW